MLHVVPFLYDSVLHRVGDLQHASCGCCFVAAHDIFDDKAIVSLFLGSKDRPANYGRELEFGKVLEKWDVSWRDRSEVGGKADGKLTVAAYPTFRKPVPPSRTVRLTLVGDNKGIRRLHSTYWRFCHDCEGQSVLDCSLKMLATSKRS